MCLTQSIHYGGAHVAFARANGDFEPPHLDGPINDLSGLLHVGALQLVTLHLQFGNHAVAIYGLRQVQTMAWAVRVELFAVISIRWEARLNALADQLELVSRCGACGRARSGSLACSPLSHGSVPVSRLTRVELDETSSAADSPRSMARLYTMCMT